MHMTSSPVLVEALIFAGTDALRSARISGVSANLHDQPPCKEASEVARLFPDDVALVLDGGPAPGKAPSTIVDLTGAQPEILREGAIPREALDRFLH